MKKIIAIFVAFNIFFVPLSFAESNNKSATESNDGLDMKTKTIMNLGIIKGDDTGDLRLSSNVTRGEFAVIIYNLLNYSSNNQPQPSRQIFSDVKLWHWAAGYIQSLSEMGAISGYADGTFLPDMEVSQVEAYKMLLSIAGYDDYAKAKGEYPNSYIMLAANTGLSKNIKGEIFGSLSRLEMAHLIYNLLDIDTIVNKGVGNGNLTYEKGKPFLTEIMKLYTDKGIVTANNASSLKGGKGVSEGRVELDYIQYNTNNTDFSDLLGYKVKYYYKIDEDAGNDTICFVIQEENYNSVLELDRDDVQGVVDRVYTYYENGKSKEARMIPGVDIIYNGRAVFDDKHFLPQYGKIHLIDNTGDDEYDVVIISDFTTIVVDGVSAQQNKIFGKNNMLSLENTEKYELKDSKGRKLSLADLEDGMVITAEVSLDGSYIKMYASNATVEGIADEVSESDGKKSIVVNGKAYVEIPSVYIRGWKGSANENVKLYLDINGCIAAVYSVSAVADDTWQYGYVIDAGKGKKGISREYQLKILSHDGNINIINCSEKVLLDGSKAEIEDLSIVFEIDESMPRRQVIRFKKSGDKIKLIDTAIVKASFDTTPIFGQADDNRLMLRVSNDLNYKKKMNIFKRKAVGNPDGEIIPSEGSVIFLVPNKTEKDVKDEDFSVKKITDLSDNTRGFADSYNTVAESIKGDVIVMYGKSDVLDEPDPVLLVDKITQAVSYDGESTLKVKGLCNGEYVEKVAKSISVLQDSSGKLPQRGDTIRIHLNKNSEVSAMELLYSERGGGKLTENVFTYGDTAVDSEMRFVYGYIEKKEGGNFLLRYKNDARNPEFCSTSGFNIYVYDKGRQNADRGAGSVYLGSFGDIIDKITSANGYSRIIMHTRNATAMEIIVYNDSTNLR